MADRLPPETERVLIERLHRCDVDAIAPLYDAYYPALLRWIRSRGRGQDAEDIAQDCFLLFYRKCCDGDYTYQEGQFAFSFLCGIAKFKMLSSGAAGARQVNEASLSPAAPEDSNTGFLQALYEKVISAAEHANGGSSEEETQYAWDQAVTALNEAEQELLELHYVEGMTQAEIAIVLRKSVGWVNKALREAQVRAMLPLVWEDIAVGIEESDQRLLAMRYRDGMKPKEIAQALGQSVAGRLKAAESNFLKRLHPDMERDHDER